MAMLHELIKPGVPAKLKLDFGASWGLYRWDGEYLWDGPNKGILTKILFSNDWEFDEPTVEDVLKDRGYRFFNSSISGVWVGTDQDGSILLLASKPTTATEMTRIIDFLESLNK